MNSISAGAVQLMQELHRLSLAATQSSAASSLSADQGVEGAASTGSFASILKSSLEQVNASQTQADTLNKQYEMGVSGVDLSDVMVAMQKASLSLQMVQNVRGRLVSAYQDLMNTPL